MLRYDVSVSPQQSRKKLPQWIAPALKSGCSKEKMTEQTVDGSPEADETANTPKRRDQRFKKNLFFFLK
jgi:hypothetical protein